MGCGSNLRYPQAEFQEREKAGVENDNNRQIQCLQFRSTRKTCGKTRQTYPNRAQVCPNVPKRIQIVAKRVPIVPQLQRQPPPGRAWGRIDALPQPQDSRAVELIPLTLSSLAATKWAAFGESADHFRKDLARGNADT